MDKVLLINDKSESKSLLIKSLEAAGFEIISVENGLISVDLPQDKLIPTEESKNSHTLNSIFPSIPRLYEVFEFIELNYHQPIKLKEVAQAVGYSSAYLTDLVRRMTGKTVNDWIVERRIVEARRLLLETEDSIEKIAVKVGYKNLNHFYCQFRDFYHKTPGSWRKQQLLKQE
ncbi:helix-turn-helix domain-containing protein [Mastigocoleus testarum]|uniref:AraC family transcriptional regulator n=1 Tax=Mastigocoleus testarum BC008 TaxID=371196 RepID=A0A0V7ZCH9_9CYAN|nr:AraC family transcriptional regulator [Mastigocoleus testarum]KST62209.1 AraC family transcriptional regulator [Mastigocoleus testarum BC008]KST64839.1 AraC family transcriptional regulator [Mastigocoleus testarum BC008]